MIYPIAEQREHDGALELDLRIPAGEDHIVIMRRTKDNCSYKLSFLTHVPELSVEQLVEKTKEQGQMTRF